MRAPPHIRGRRQRLRPHGGGVVPERDPRVRTSDRGSGSGQGGQLADGAYPGPRHIQGCVTGLGGRLAESRQDGVAGCIRRGRLKRKGLQ